MYEPSLDKQGSQVTEKSVDAALVESGGTISTPESLAYAPGAPMKNMPRVWLKMDLLALPIVVLMYSIYILDKSNVGNARIAGLQETLQMSDTQFSLALTTTFIAQLFMPIMCNYFTMIVGPRWVLPTMVSLGGTAVALQGVVKNVPGFIAIRIFLGLAEGGILAGVNLYLASFYPRRKLQFRISILWSGVSLALLFSGLLAAALLRLDGVGHRPGWEWIFIVEGVFTAVFGLGSFLCLPNSPGTAWFLTKEERVYIMEVLHRDGLLAKADKQENKFLHEVRKAFAQPHVIMLTLAAFFVDFTATSLAYFLPSIVEGLGYKGKEGQLRVVPPFAVSIVVSIATAIIADRYAVRGATMIILATMSTIGFAIFLASSDDKVRYGSLFLSVPGAFGGIVPLSTWLANNVAPMARCSVALGVIVTITNFSSTLAVWMFGPISAPPKYTAATITLLVFQIGMLGCAVGTQIYLLAENRRKARLREAAMRDRQERDEEEKEKGANDSIWFTYVM
ncbi:MFS general substrate transporter [Daedaleopsis nitida]|nr:MFS general substrate transporter [Daedaleopsis nitida]